MRQQERGRRFVEKIWQWYAKHKRTLPWRDLKIPDDAQRAYMILVSEVMLQQTQVPRVVVLFPRFLQKFPTIHDLAKASNRDVLIAWRGMGYNSRALRLRDAARTIVTRCGVVGNKRVTLSSSKGDTRAMVRRAHHDTLFPCSMKELLQIPGIGPYTAAAIRNFAFGVPTPCVDVNIERILRRVFGVKTKKVGERAGEVLKVAIERGNRCNRRNRGNRGGSTSSVSSDSSVSSVASAPAAQWHSALMDFGSLVCMKRKPLCSQCPLSQGICRSAFRTQCVTLSSSKGDTAVSRRVTRGGPKNEPGRIVAGRFIPNRIVRGKIVDLLRDHPQGLTLERLGRAICSDWSSKQQLWLKDIIAKLRREKMVEERSGKRYVLPERPQKEAASC